MRPSPFIVFSLPRSRSAWLARFLSYGSRKCGHDLATQCATMAEFAELLNGDFSSAGVPEYAGTAETGAMIGWRAIRSVLPEIRVAMVRRPVQEVFDSLSRFGLGSPALMKMLIERDAMLDQIMQRVPGVKSFSFADLDSIDTCRELFEFCLGIPFDWQWWEGLANVNIQVDVPAQMIFLTENRNRIEALKRDAAHIAPNVVIEREPWDTVWPEIDGLFAEHFAEVEGDLARNRPYKLDEPLMRKLHAAGVLRIITARVDGKLAGYCMWQVSKDAESAGMLIAQHAPWFVRKRFAHLLLGVKLFDASLDDLRSIGVKNAFPHHRLEGRGKKLGAFFKRRGAVETQHTYSLWLGEAHA